MYHIVQYHFVRVPFCTHHFVRTFFILDVKVVSSYPCFFFSFLRFHQLADDEVLIIYFSKLLYSWFFHMPVDNCMSLSSSLTLPIHLFLCFLCFFSLTCPCSAAFGSHFPFILSTRPNHVSLLLLISSTTVSSAPSSSLVFSFPILYLLLLPLILLNHAISATSNLLSSFFLSVQHSDPYINTGSTSAQYSFILVLSDMLSVLHILSNASQILLLISSEHLPSSVSVPPRYMNFVACSITSPPSFIFIHHRVVFQLSLSLSFLY